MSDSPLTIDWKALFDDAQKQIDVLRAQLAAFEAAYEREYIIVAESAKHRHARHPNVRSAICEAMRLTRKFGRPFTVCKVKGTVQERPKTQSREPDQLGE